MRINSNVYNYLGTDLVPKKRETTHKSSELKAVSANITKYNQNSPLFIVSRSNTNQTRMINIKEAAISLVDAIADFSNAEGQVYSQRVFHSENDEYISGAFRHQSLESLPDKLDIDVKELATNQVNVGHALEQDEHSIPAGEYTFSVTNQKKTTNFAVTISEEDTNLDIQTKLATYINNRNLGITSTIVTENNLSSMIISSDATGVPPTFDKLFFSFKDVGNDVGLTEILGLNNISVEPTNATFSINGDTHTSATNHISINQLVELDFHKPTEKPLEITFSPDSSYANTQVDLFIDAYNNLVDLSHSNSQSFGSRNLLMDVAKITAKHKADFESIGITFDDAGYMTKNSEVLQASIKTGRFQELFCASDDILNDVTEATNRLTLDPAAYIDKILVTYPNSNVANKESYSTSIYSGLMFNNYA